MAAYGLHTAPYGLHVAACGRHMAACGLHMAPCGPANSFSNRIKIVALQVCVLQATEDNKEQFFGIIRLA